MKKLLLFTLLLFALCQLSLLAQHPVQEITRIPFRLENGELIIDVQIADNVFPMVVDTKSKGLFLYRWAQAESELKMKYKPGYGGGRDSLLLGQTRIERIDIGSVHFKPGRVKVYKNSHWFKMRGNPVAGVIGSDLFKRYIVHFDFEELQLQLYDPGTFEAGDRFKTGTVEISRGALLVAANFVFPGDREKNEWVMLSTGYGGAICIKHKAAKKYGLFDAGVQRKALRAFEWPGHIFPAALSLGYDFNERAVVREKQNINIASDTLFVHFDSDEYWLDEHEPGQPWLNGFIRIHNNDFDIIGDTLLVSDFELKKMPSRDSLFHVNLIYSARGRTRSEARRRAKAIEFQYELRNNHLILKPYFSLGGEPYRVQSVKALIQVPEGKTVIMEME